MTLSTKDHCVCSLRMVCFCERKKKRKYMNSKVVLYLAIYCGHEQTHMFERKHCVPYVMNVEVTHTFSRDNIVFLHTMCC